MEVMYWNGNGYPICLTRPRVQAYLDTRCRAASGAGSWWTDQFPNDPDTDPAWVLSDAQEITRIQNGVTGSIQAVMPKPDYSSSPSGIYTYSSDSGTSALLEARQTFPLPTSHQPGVPVRLSVGYIVGGNIGSAAGGNFVNAQTGTLEVKLYESDADDAVAIAVKNVTVNTVGAQVVAFEFDALVAIWNRTTACLGIRFLTVPNGAELPFQIGAGGNPNIPDCSFRHRADALSWITQSDYSMTIDVEGRLCVATASIVHGTIGIPRYYAFQAPDDLSQWLTFNWDQYVPAGCKLTMTIYGYTDPYASASVTRVLSGPGVMIPFDKSIKCLRWQADFKCDDYGWNQAVLLSAPSLSFFVEGYGYSPKKMPCAGVDANGRYYLATADQSQDFNSEALVLQAEVPGQPGTLGTSNDVIFTRLFGIQANLFCTYQLPQASPNRMEDFLCWSAVDDSTERTVLSLGPTRTGLLPVDTLNPHPLCETYRFPTVVAESPVRCHVKGVSARFAPDATQDVDVYLQLVGDKNDAGVEETWDWHIQTPADDNDGQFLHAHVGTINSRAVTLRCWQDSSILAAFALCEVALDLYPFGGAYDY